MDPIGDYRSDFNAAQIMSLVFNIATSLWGKEGQKKMSSPSDFMITWGQEEEDSTGTKVQSVEQMKAELMAIAKMQNLSEEKVRRRDSRSLYKKRKDLK